MVQQILRYGRVLRPWLGVRLQPTSTAAVGLLVVSVVRGSPADKAGLRPGDFLVALDAHPVHTVMEVTRILERHRVGDDVSARLLRGDAFLTVTFHLVEMPGSLKDVG